MARPGGMNPTGLPSSILFLSPLLEILALTSLYYISQTIKNPFSRLIPLVVFGWLSGWHVFYGSENAIFSLTSSDSFWLKIATHLFYIQSSLVIITLGYVLSFIKPEKKTINIFFAGVASLVEAYSFGIDLIPVGLTWIELAPHLSLAPIFGTIIYGFVSYGSACLLAIDLKNWKKGILFIATFIIFNAIPINEPKIVRGKKKVYLGQTFIEPRSLLVKRLGTDAASSLMLSELRKNVPVDPTIDLFIFPESSWPFLVPKEQKDWPNFKQEFGLPPSAALVFGGSHLETFDPILQYYNTMFLIDSLNRVSLQDKTRLMPVGEDGFYFLSANKVAQLFQWSDKALSSRGYQELSLDKDTKFIGLVCFDADLNLSVRKHLLSNSGINFAVMIANEAWFNTVSQAFVHQWRQRWISAVFEIPLVRVANKGFSSVSVDGVNAIILDRHEAGRTYDLDIHEPRLNIFTDLGLIPFMILLSIVLIIRGALWKLRS